MFSRKTTLIVSTLGVFLLAASFVGNTNLNVLAEKNTMKCEDIKYEDDPLKWKSTDHDDNNPSEKKFFNDMDENTFCEHAKGIDHMKYEGAIREDSKHDWDWFENTMVYQSAGEETQEQLEDRYELPDNGKKNLEAYEFLEAIY